MNLIYLKDRDEHLNLARIERVCHDVPHEDSVVTIVYLIVGGHPDKPVAHRLHIHSAADRALLRERLDAIANVSSSKKREAIGEEHSMHVGNLTEEVSDAPRLQNTGIGRSVLANPESGTKVQPIGYSALAGEDAPFGIGNTAIY